MAGQALQNLLFVLSHELFHVEGLHVLFKVVNLLLLEQLLLRLLVPACEGLFARVFLEHRGLRLASGGAARPDRGFLLVADRAQFDLRWVRHFSFCLEQLEQLHVDW